SQADAPPKTRDGAATRARRAAGRVLPDHDGSGTGDGKAPARREAVRDGAASGDGEAGSAADDRDEGGHEHELGREGNDVVPPDEGGGELRAEAAPRVLRPGGRIQEPGVGRATRHAAARAELPRGRIVDARSERGPRGRGSAEPIGR